MNSIFHGVTNIFRSKTRSVLTICGIAIGVFAVVVISAIGASGTKEVSKSLVSMGINSILVQSAENAPPADFTDEDVEALVSIKGVKKAMPLMAAITESKLMNQSINCLAWGINEDAKEIINIVAKHGRLIKQSDVSENRKVCVVDEEIALKTYGRSNIVGKKIKVFLGTGFDEYEIVGIAKSGISSLQNALSGIIPNFVYLPFSTVQSILGRTNYDKIAVLVNEQNANDEITNLIQNKINRINNVTSGINVSNLLHQKNQLEGMLGTVTTVLSLIAGISLFVSGITVMTTMLVSVNERTREIGIKKSIGAKSGDIMGEFLLESTLLGIMGSAVGIASGLAITFLGCFIFGIEFCVDFSSIITAFLVSVGMGTVFGVYPALKAARMKPIDALKR